MDKKTIQIIPFTGRKKWRMWSGKFTVRSVIKEYHEILTIARTILAYDKEKTKEKEIFELNLPNFTAYN